MTHKVKIILADDHALLRSGLKLLLQSDPSLEIIGEASDGVSLLHVLESKMADVIILDLSMPNMDGIQCIREIKSRGYKSKIVVLTMHEDENYIIKVMHAGAMAYVQKGAVDTEIFEAIRNVQINKTYISREATQVILTALLSGKEYHPSPDDPYVLLSPREREVVKFLARGYSLIEIGEALSLSSKTIETYKNRIMEKLNFTKKREIVDYALKHRLLS
ncbi:MAG: two component transcriptional regulator, LuxR family [Pelosinus sp.]|jgi:DNA-binding NarL/FixJ family response regulator|nr:two component transcriptional regulator, LuxR family [Pelosinus sp.]